MIFSLLTVILLAVPAAFQVRVDDAVESQTTYDPASNVETCDSY